MRLLILFLVVQSAVAAAAETGQPGHAMPVPAKPAAAGHAAKPAASHKPSPKPSAKPSTKPGTKPPPAPAPTAPPVAETPPAPKPHESKTGLPVPRFAALGSDTVNFRVGPDEKFPIKWVYKRRDLPIKIVRDYNNWRLVEDPDGDKGWVHALTLTGRRSAVTVAGAHTLRDEAGETAGAVAKLQAGVIVRVRSCEAASDWCRVAIGDYAGYIKRSEIWGVLPGEVVQ